MTEFGYGGEIMSRKCGKNGVGLTAFGAGMLLALLCPTRFVLIVVAAAFVLLGISCSKKR